MDSTGKQNEAKGHEIESSAPTTLHGVPQNTLYWIPSGRGWVWMGRWWKVVQTTQNTCIIQILWAWMAQSIPGRDKRFFFSFFLSQTSTQVWSPPNLIFNVYWGGRDYFCWGQIGRGVKLTTYPIYTHAPHNDVSVNDQPHIRWWLQLPTVFSTVTCCTGL